MLSKALRRKRRARKTRSLIRETGQPRLCVHKSLKHFYAQLIIHEEKGDRTVTSVSTLDPVVRNQHKLSSNTEGVIKLGEIFSQKISALNIKRIAFDRSGNKYGKKLKAFADSIRTASNGSILF